MSGEYNGFSGAQRAAKGAALRKLKAAGQDPTPKGPCMLCGDPEAKLHLHSESYAEPHEWTPPHCYAICSHCHWYLHQRQGKPQAWDDFVTIVLVGGFGHEARAEIKKLRERREKDEFYEPRHRPNRPRHEDNEWWIELAMQDLLKKLEAETEKRQRMLKAAGLA